MGASSREILKELGMLHGLYADELCFEAHLC